eukprot:scaffold90509_cov87-Cyclotella_meneghiniana.AAC.2
MDCESIQSVPRPHACVDISRGGRLSKRRGPEEVRAMTAEVMASGLASGLAVVEGVVEGVAEADWT